MWKGKIRGPYSQNAGNFINFPLRPTFVPVPVWFLLRLQHLNMWSRGDFFALKLENLKVDYLACPKNRNIFLPCMRDILGKKKPKQIVFFAKQKRSFIFISCSHARTSFALYLIMEIDPALARKLSITLYLVFICKMASFCAKRQKSRPVISKCSELHKLPLLLRPHGFFALNRRTVRVGQRGYARPLPPRLFP